MATKRAPLTLALAALVMAAVVVAPGLASGTSAEPTAHASALAKWQGRWQTNFGPLRMNQSGRRVTGSYNSGNGHIAGRARGDTGRVLPGRWTQSGGTLRGSFRFVISANGCRFRGFYQTTYGGSAEGAWSGRLLVPRC
jgi:hypothetical protein